MEVYKIYASDDTKVYPKIEICVEGMAYISYDG